MAVIEYRGALYTVRDDESALEALIRGGADIRFSCRKGSCQTCMMRAVEGTPTERAQRGLRPELAQTGHFMPCVERDGGDLKLAPPDLTELLLDAQVSQIRRLDERVIRLSLEPERNLNAKPGQYFNLYLNDDLFRSYSLRGIIEEDYFIEVDIQRVPGGAFSEYAHFVLEEGAMIRIQGPLGEMHYRPEVDQGKKLVLIGTGTGVAPLHAIARDALRHGHEGGIHLYYGAREAAQLYAHPELLPLREAGVDYRPITLEGEADDSIEVGDLIERAFSDHPELGGAILFLAGDAELVQRARARAILAGASREDVRADPFESPIPSEPRDTEILSGIRPDPELWEALDHGKKLRAILEDFYTEVYSDARLSPFFHNATKERAISKQYEFLADLFQGTKRYFGLKPFNAHHWMVISDELFDYREAMFERHLRAHQLPEPFIRRFMFMHELFRREIVKSTARGLFIDGVEQLKEGYDDETLTIDAVCDGCFEEMLAGSRGRMHRRTGQLYCEGCHARSA